MPYVCNISLYQGAAAGNRGGFFFCCQFLRWEESNEQKSEETEAETTESAAENKSTEASAETTVASAGVIEDQVELTQTPEYAIQFGSYSTKDAAEKSAAQLKQSGIKVEVVEKDGAYKVISKLFDTKEKAKAVLNEMDASLGAFVTTIK